MVVLLLAANLLFSLPVMMLVLLLVLRTAGGTLAADRMLADKVDLNWITDLFNHQLQWASFEASGTQVAAMLLVMGGSYLLLSTLFAGGIIGTFASEGGHFTMRKFWWHCGAYFWRFLRLLSISLVFDVAVLILYFLTRWWVDQFEAQATAYAPVVFRKWATVLPAILFLAFINLVFDYARIGTVINDSRRMLRETVRAWRFALRHFFSVFGLHLVIGVVGLVLFTSLAVLRNSINQGSIVAVLMAIFVGQLAITSRIWTRLTSYAAELNFYRQHYAPPRRPMIFPEEHEELDFLDETSAGSEYWLDDQVDEQTEKALTDNRAVRAEEERKRDV